MIEPVGIRTLLREMFVVEVVLDEREQPSPAGVDAPEVVANSAGRYYPRATTRHSRRCDSPASANRGGCGRSRWSPMKDDQSAFACSSERISARRSSVEVAPFWRMRATSPLRRRRSSSVRSLAVMTMTGMWRQSARCAEFLHETRSRPSPASSDRAGSVRGCFRVEPFESDPAVGGFGHLPAFLLHAAAEHVAGVGVVLDDQHGLQRWSGGAFSARRRAAASRWAW